MKLAADLTCLMLCPLPHWNPTSGVVDTYNSQIRVSHFLLYFPIETSVYQDFPIYFPTCQLNQNYFLPPSSSSQQRTPDLSGRCRTSTASARSQWALLESGARS